MTTFLPPSSESPHGARRTGLTRREMAFVVAFWLGYALLTLANRIFDPGGGPPGSIDGRVLVAAAESACWIILTPALFRVAARVELDDWEEARGRGRQVAELVLAAVVAAIAVALIGTELRALTASSPSQAFDGAVRRGRPGPGPGGPRFWFGFINAIVLSLGITAVGLARALSLSLRARREQSVRLEMELTAARLDALRRQLDPHFLFNTLNAVSSLVERDPRGVRRMIARLGDLLRFSFEGGSAPEVPLRQELVLLGRYVDIMQVRFQGRLDVAFDVSDATLDALVPTLILQPLVENAIEHGVERSTEGGRILVESVREGDALVLRVHNRAASSDDAARGGGSGAGVGLRNTRARLEHLYGERQRFTLAHTPLGDTIAEARLPYHADTSPRADDAAAVDAPHPTERSANAG